MPESKDFSEFLALGAHELRASLRAIELCRQELSPRAQDDPALQQFLALCQDQVADMQTVIAAMIDYWDAANLNAASPVKLDLPLMQAMLKLESQLDRAGAKVTYDPLPMVRGDTTWLTKVFTCLLSNAILFRGAGPPRIHVSAVASAPSADAASDWVIAVADNGPGIAPVFRERIFAPFKRLHGKDYPGHGLGLAICKRIVEAHGGRIWVDAGPEGGSIFRFTLRATDANPATL